MPIHRTQPCVVAARFALTLALSGAGVAVLAVACGGSPSEPREEPDPEWLVCGDSAECVLVEVGCCDHCNGGRVIAVHRDHADQAAQEMRPTDCPNECTDRGCEPPTAACEEGSCVLVPSGPACSSLNEAGCQAAEHCTSVNAGEVDCEQLAGGPPQFIACVEPTVCGGPETCGLDPATGVAYIFGSACLPPGYVTCDLAEVCADE